MADSKDPTSNNGIQRNEISELFEAFRSLSTVLGVILEQDSSNLSSSEKEHPTVQYYNLLRGIIGKGEYSLEFLNYCSQQNNRLSISIAEYREEYGNGDWLTNYEAIPVQQLSNNSQKIIDQRNLLEQPYKIVRPVAPRSQEPLPERIITKAELQEAILLLTEFPALPSKSVTERSSQERFPIREVYQNIRSDISNQSTTIELSKIPESEIKIDRSENIDSIDKYKQLSNNSGTISETLNWLRQNSFHESEIVHEYEESAQIPKYSEQVPITNLIWKAARHEDITDLYRHQVRAINKAQSGDNIIISTETASGKSLPYKLLAFDRSIKYNKNTLYIAPQKALINDQYENFRELASNIPQNKNVSVNTYTGDTPDEKRRNIRRQSPDILLMTPELVHLSLLPHHHLWEQFLQDLETVVIDEIHEFRGISGSHIGLVCRRINRLLDKYQQTPNYFCCSATIDNPVDHASSITGKSKESFSLVDEDDSEHGRRFWLLYNPPIKKSNTETHTSENDSEDSEFGEYPDDWNSIRNRVYNRDNQTCQQCLGQGGSKGDKELHAHHIVSPAHGGTHELANLVTLCSKCHSKEHGRKIGRQAYSEDSTHVESEKGQPKVPAEVREGNERKSNHPVSIRLFTELVARGHQTLVFTQSRQGAGRYATQSAKRLNQMENKELADKIKAYHAALQNEDREAIEKGLHEGSIRGAWSTNALELGVDIGNLDVIIIDGHPGTNMSLFQQTGRGGRGSNDCLIILVASPNPLDQYCVENPEAIFNESPGSAQINIENKTVLPDHIVSAADERPLRPGDKTHFGPSFPEHVSKLTDQDRLIRSSDRNGIYWSSSEQDTQYEMTFRIESDSEYSLIDIARDEIIEELPFPDVLRDCHPSAIYTHKKRSYEVTEFDETSEIVRLKETKDTEEYTLALADQSVSIDTVLKEHYLNDHSDAKIGFAELIYQEQVDGYLHFEHPNDQEPTEHEILEKLPKYRLQTQGMYITIPQSLKSRIENMVDLENPVLMGIHGVEHGLRSMFPLEILCSDSDLIGLSMAGHSHTDAPTIFLLDGFQGGAGLTERGFSKIEDLLNKAHDLIDSCDCYSGCPSCIHHSQCRARNRSLNKELSLFVLNQLLS